MSNDRPTKDEPDRFAQLVGEVRPLKQDRVEPYRDPPAPVPDQSLRDQQAVIDELLSDDVEPAEIETGEELLYARPGLQRTTLRKLRRGIYAIEAELDLHGLRVADAHAALSCFLREVQLSGKRCVRIIHGKGHGSVGRLPVLKGKVCHWLRRRAEVLAFCSARPNDGGTGAVYVLIARRD